MPYTDHLNLEQLNEISGFDLIFEKEIFDLYEQQFHEKYELLEKALKIEDKTNSVLYSHDIKGSSANIGAFHMQAISAKMEHFSKEENFAAAAQLLPDLTSEFKLLIKAMNEYMTEKTEELQQQQNDDEDEDEVEDKDKDTDKDKDNEKQQSKKEKETQQDESRSGNKGDADKNDAVSHPKKKTGEEQTK